MDLFIVVIDTLVVLLYIALFAFITPYIMRFLKRRNCDTFVQLVPVVALIFVSSIAISMGYGGFSETLFFRLTSILGAVILGILLFLTLMMKKLWTENYSLLISRLPTFQKKRSKFSEIGIM